MERKYDLEDRLINFAVRIVELVQELPEKKALIHLGGQLVRSGTSPALNYGEAQSGESRRDFIHKMKIVLKELRETSVCLNIIYRTGLAGNNEGLEIVLRENNELIAIFVKSIQTTERNQLQVKTSNRSYPNF
jgi:four helix bundle protein